jgi:uncharacterized protein
MPNRLGNDDRTTATTGLTDRGGQREASTDSARQNGLQAGTSAGSGTAVAPTRTRSNRGFASMDRGKQKEIASKGGKAAHAKGTAHEFDSGEAREAGRKGGEAVSRNREHMASIGRRGGEARGQSRGRPTVGAGLDSNLQNPRSSGTTAERQVALNRDGVTADTQGARGGGNNSLGGERRPQGTSAAIDTPARGESSGTTGRLP